MDFVEIEEMVGFNLPWAYKKLIENFPAHFRKVCGTSLLYESLDEIYEANRIVQAGDYCQQLAANMQSWPEYHFVIGDSGCGDWYVLVTNDDELEECVVFWNHETGSFSESWPTLYNCLDSHYAFFHMEGSGE